MSRFTVRRYEERDRDAFAHVRSMVYRGGGEVRPDETLLRDDCLGYIVEDENRIVGTATAVRMTCSLNGVDLSCAGIAAVAVLQEERQTGAGTALMNGVVRLCREDGFEMSSLYPFRETWYRRFGYATTGLRWKITCPTDRFPRIDAPLGLRLLPAMSAQESMEVLRGVEDAMAKRHCGYNRRSPDQAWRMLGGDTPFTIYVAGDPIEAYCMVRLRDDFWNWVEIREMGWSTDAGYQSLIAHFYRLSLNHLGVVWPEPIAGPYLTRFVDQGVKAETNALIMFRVLDASRVNEVLGSQIRVKDPILGTEGDVDVEEFSRAAMGHDTVSLPALTRQVCYCADFF